jgi:hypothetical protein
MAGFLRAATALVAVAIVGAGAVDASAATSKPAILSLTATPQTLPSSGGTVVLSARVKNASRCTLGGKAVACASGSASTSFLVAANTSQADRAIRYVVSAVGAKSASVQRTVSVVEAAFISPVVIAASALPQGTVGTGYSANVVASGGTPPYAWSVVSGALPAGVSMSSSGAIAGTPTGAVHAAFTVQVTDSSPSPQSTTAPFSIDVIPPALVVSRTSFPQGTVGVFYSTTLAATGGTPPYTWSLSSGSLPTGLKLSTGGAISGTPLSGASFTFTTRVTDSAGTSTTSSLTIVVVAPAISPTSEVSGNWSGYVADGNYTVVQGTFNVPSVPQSATSSHTAEWVGIDGASSADPSLIQAGVEETYNAATNSFVTYAWWEILPAPETPISSLIVSPRAGDQMTITISQLSGSSWSIRVSDDTTGQVFSTTQSYSGPGTSAEWILEAPSSGATQTVLTLGAYTPNVTFSNLRFTGTQTSLTKVLMSQGGAIVSTPSALTSNGFTVAYASAAPSPP